MIYLYVIVPLGSFWGGTMLGGWLEYRRWHPVQDDVNVLASKSHGESPPRGFFEDQE